MEGITKIWARHLQKIVEARGEHQTTRYPNKQTPNNKLSEKNTGTPYTLSRPPRYSLNSLPNTQLNNHILSIYTFSITTQYSTVTIFTEKHSKDKQNTCSGSSIIKMCDAMRCNVMYSDEFLS